jgi:hypothetical protein
VYLVGPHVAGISLQEVLSMPAARSLPFIGRLVNALLLLSERGAGWFPLQSDSVLFAGQDSVLFLPPEVDRELRDLRPFVENRETWECLNHPDLKGPARSAFSIAACLYRIMTGRFPFWGEDAADLHEQVRNREIQPPARLVPGLERDISEAIMAGLGRGSRGTISLEELRSSLESWQDRDLVHPLSEELRQSALAAAGAGEASAERSFRRRRFWRKNWRVAAVIAAAAVVVGAVGGTMVKNFLAPRATRGFDPRSVVETFYTGMNTLDHATMQACVVGSAGQDEINEATTLYVTSRVTQGYEGRSNVISAAEWNKAGRPPLVSPTSLYGVTGLAVTEEQGPPRPVFLVKYDKWNPAAPPDASPGAEVVPRSEGHSVIDRVWLKTDKGDWVIEKIQRLRRVELPPPLTAPAG